MTADVIAWLRSPEGEQWSRDYHRPSPGSASGPPHLYQSGPGDPSEDPCGRPPANAAAAPRDYGPCSCHARHGLQAAADSPDRICGECKARSLDGCERAHEREIAATRETG